MELCAELLEKLKTQEYALPFTKPLDPQEYEITQEEYNHWRFLFLFWVIREQELSDLGVQSNQIMNTNLDTIKSLKEESTDMKKK